MAESKEEPKEISAELYRLLERLARLHRDLAGLLQEEYAHMSRVDNAGLAETARSKEAMLAEIWSREQERIAAAAALAGALGLDAGTSTLLAIAGKLPSREAERLRAARQALELLVRQARELNARNMAFAESSLDRIEKMKRNALGIASTAEGENYSASGERQPAAARGGRLLSTEA